jgi:hypothetical protein
MDNLCWRLTTLDFGSFEFLPKDLDEKFGTYGLDADALGKLFKNAENCQNATPGGEVQTAALPTDGTLPQCFVNMKVQKGIECPDCFDGGCLSEIKQQC